MTFDARAAKLLQAGEHLTSTDHPGLRLEAFADRRTWTYRYRSPVDGRLRQTKIGTWPEVSVHAAVVAWEGLRRQREAGGDPASEARARRKAVRAEAEQVRESALAEAYTVAAVADDYWRGHVAVSRAEKGAKEIKRMFATMLGKTGLVPASQLTRAQAFDLLQSFALVPVQAAKLRAELGAAWDYGYDSGRLPESVPNWWRQVMRGRLKSKGKMVAGKKTGVVKRALRDEEIGPLIRWLPNFSKMIDDVLTMYLWTGTRGAEIVAMEGAEVMLEADGILWWSIPKLKTKNARHDDATDLRVPLFGRARVIVERRKARYGDGWLFPATGRDGRVRATEQKTIQTTVWVHQPYSTTRPELERPRLAVTHWAPHDLRRTVRTQLAAMGCPDTVGEVVLGHMIKGVAGVYNRHSYDSERALWLNAWSDRLEGFAAGSLLVY